MELWELNQCVRSYNRMERHRQREMLAQAWHTANFSGAAFGGKLRKLNDYIDESTQNKAPQISKEEFERRLARAKNHKKGDAEHGTV